MKTYSKSVFQELHRIRKTNASSSSSNEGILSINIETHIFYFNGNPINNKILSIEFRLLCPKIKLGIYIRIRSDVFIYSTDLPLRMYIYKYYTSLDYRDCFVDCRYLNIILLFRGVDFISLVSVMHHYLCVACTFLHTLSKRDI